MSCAHKFEERRSSENPKNSNCTIDIVYNHCVLCGLNRFIELYSRSELVPKEKIAFIEKIEE